MRKERNLVPSNGRIKSFSNEIKRTPESKHMKMIIRF